MPPSKSSLVLFASALVIALALGAGTAEARPKRADRFQYTTSFSCGATTGAGSAVDGEYSTAVNLLNTGISDATVQASLALTRPPIEPETGATSSALDLVVSAGGALQIDCEEIVDDFLFVTPHAAGEALQGFLVIESDQPLEAEAVHTATRLGGGSEVSIDVERLGERRVAQRPVVAPSTVTICHIPPGNPSAAQTIQVGSSAVSAHRAHGDTLGSCPR